ncbi:hypothetical protein BN59_03543 [Legionella massiliensis]|uniref:Uncharacterized protein n=1 Tax=Legionella massiliensis TaxID=1034943 RepID=A0A078KXS3_9GAMM|nr:hypothetical protein [Legionella massiliensis]CDZ79225.1 hypothetical protein BN59_03543 [Legionella massiliensis]CEE14963.1 hypothetical protein BN1094_03543 [Legionella massiliensis]
MPLTNKIQKLTKICEQHRQDLIASLQGNLFKMPKDVVNDYVIHDTLNLEKLFKTANTGVSLYWSSAANQEKYRWEKHSSESHPKLHLIIKKLNLIDRMLVHLNSEHPELEIGQFKELLTVDNKALLKKRYEKKSLLKNPFESSEGEHFLKTISDLLAKTEKYSGVFWQPGEKEFKAQSDSSYYIGLGRKSE